LKRREGMGIEVERCPPDEHTYYPNTSAEGAEKNI
jgi:hypothetical protein